MSKILLVGEKNDYLKGISFVVSNEGDVHSCDYQSELVVRNIKILRPDSILVIKPAESDVDVIDAILDSFPDINVVILADEEDESLNRFKDDQVTCLYQPVNTDDIISAIKSKFEPEIVPSEKKKILAVDNSGMMLRQIRAMIQDLYDVSFATTGKKALSMLRNRDFDLILLDYEMPEMSGYDVLMEIRKDPDLSKIPVVFLTAVSDQARIIDVVKLKPAGYLLKPIDSEHLKQTVYDILG